MHLFVIMGLSSELLQMFAADLSRSRLASLVPLGCQIVPYDELLRRFEDTVPEQLTVFVPSLSTIESDSTEIAFLRACEEFFGESADSGSGRSLVLKRANELAFRAARLFARSGVPPRRHRPRGNRAAKRILELRQTHARLTTPSACASPPESFGEFPRSGARANRIARCPRRTWTNWTPFSRPLQRPSRSAWPLPRSFAATSLIGRCRRFRSNFVFPSC